jgi:AcrR family transcriptional regulator
MSDFPWRPGSPRRPLPEQSAKIPLTRTEIVQTALRIVRTEGIDAVSMRRIAAEFETGPSSLYAHVANKDELLQLMFDEMCGLIQVPPPEPGRWKEQIKELARSGYRTMLDHNDLARAALATIPTGPNAMRVSDAMLGLMLGGGIPARIAAWALDRIFLYITADAYELAIWRATVVAAGSDKETYLEQMTGDLRAYYSELPAETYPHLSKYAAELVGGAGNDDRFEFGLDLIVEGLDRYVTAEPAGGVTAEPASGVTAEPASGVTAEPASE